MAGKRSEVELGDHSQTEDKLGSDISYESLGSLGNRKGYYCDGRINDQPMSFLCDTGANVSVLSSKWFESLSENEKPEITSVRSRLLTVTGEDIAFKGKATFHITLGSQTFNQEMLISDIVENAILGMDFMKTKKCDLMISKGCLKINGENIPCYQKQNMRLFTCCRVALVENVEIPPCSEIVVSGKTLDHIDKDYSCLIEGSENFVQKTGLLVAKSVVDPNTGRIPIRLANLTDKPIKVFKDTVTATMETVEVVENELVGSTGTSDISKNLDKLPEHLVTLYEKSCANLDSSQSEVLKQFLIKHQHVFSKDSNDIGHTTLIKHEIDTGDSKPVKKYPYRIPLAKRKSAEEEIRKMEKDGIIEKCPHSPYNAPVVMVTKTDGSIRFCCDFRGLNSCTIKDSQSLPRTDDSIEALAGSKWWSCLVMKSGYWQVDIDEKDRYKTAFSIPGGEQWQWRRLAFGLCNSPATFTRLMQMVFSGLLWKIVIIYLDDIICHSKTFEGQLQNLEIVFSKLKNANLKLNAKKCILFQKQVTFLGHTISENGVGTSQEKVKDVKNWPTPKNAKEARSFISLASYYRSYVFQFAKLAKPIHELAENGRKFIWTPECAESFQKIKKALTTAPILAFPTENDHFILDCDASLTAQGAVLSQVQNGKEKVIGYYSKCFTRTERKYCVTRRELLAVVNAMKHFHHYVYGRNITVRTDHSSLTWLLNFKNVEGQLARWLTFLNEYDLTIIHRAGLLHSNADALSRRPCIATNCKYCERVESKEKEALFVASIQMSDVEKVQVKGRNRDEECDWGLDTITSLVLVVLLYLMSETVAILAILIFVSLGGLKKVTCCTQVLHKDKDDDVTGHVITGVNSVCKSDGRNVIRKGNSNSCPIVTNSQESDQFINAVDTQSTSRGDDISSHIDDQGISMDDLDVSEIQDQDNDLKVIKDMISEGEKLTWQDVSKYSPEVKHYWARIDSLVLKNGKLYRKWESEDGSSYKLLLVIPKSHRELVLKQLHDGKSGAHLGVKKTLHKVRDRYFWFKLRKDVELWVKKCDMCNSRKGTLRKSKAPLQTYKVGAPNERVAIDFMGPFVKTDRGNRFMMVVGDLFTKWTECYSIENLEASTVAKVLVDRYISHWGCPLIIHTDQGKTFESKLFQELCRLLGIEKTRSSSFRPQSNGFIEKHNHTIIKMLTPYVAENQKDWDEHVDLVMMAYRSSVQSSTGFTPSKLHIGREVRLPVDMIFGCPENQGNENCCKFVAELQKNLNKVYDLARQNMDIAVENMKSSYNTKSNLNSFKEGDAVWYYYPQRKRGLNPKFQRPWKGPCKVLNKINDVLYRIKVTAQSKPKIVHHDKLKRYTGVDRPSWF